MLKEEEEEEAVDKEGKNIDTGRRNVMSLVTKRRMTSSKSEINNKNKQAA